MADQTTIERGALALWAWDKAAFGYDDDIADAHWEHNADEYRSKTRAAIGAAMREPTPEMIDAGAESGWDWGAPGKYTALDVWQAMIDAALKRSKGMTNGGAPTAHDYLDSRVQKLERNWKEKLMTDIETIETNFSYHPPFGNQTERYGMIRDGGKKLALLILDLVPGSREQALALTNLEQAVMWANAGIARNEVNVDGAPDDQGTGPGPQEPGSG